MWKLPRVPCRSMRSSTSFSTSMFQAKSSSPVWMTALAAEVASPPPFSSIAFEEGPVGHVALRIELIEGDISWLELDDFVGSRPHRLQVVWGIASMLPFVCSEEMFGQYLGAAAGPPEGVGSWKTTFTAWSSSCSMRRILSYAPTLVAAVVGSLAYSR